MEAKDIKDYITSSKGLSIYTHNGKTFWPFDPKAEDMNIEDIAHSLSMQCRFNGHINSFYSVAQHCVIVSSLCSDKNKLWGLLHDASEAYISDLPSPIKAMLPDYEEAEKNIQKVVCEKFGLSLQEPQEVRDYDIKVRLTEMRDLRKHPKLTYKSGYSPLEDVTISPWSPSFAEAAFLQAFYLLTD